MKNIIASIVTYNPDLERLKLNILNLLKQVDEILIVDNNSSNINNIKQLLLEINNKNSIIKLNSICNKKNVGIANALNQALEYAYNNNYEWILTLDQDSICDLGLINEYKSSINLIDDENIAIISPSIVDENISMESSNMSNPMVVITSGALTNVIIAKNIGGFIDELFIDYVDFEFCLRLRVNNYQILKSHTAKLYHQLGECKIHNILNLKIVATNHSYIRRYYFYRNSIYVYKKYFKHYPKWVIKDMLSKVKTMLIILLFENEKYRKIKYSVKGIKDGLLNQYGEL